MQGTQRCIGELVNPMIKYVAQSRERNNLSGKAAVLKGHI
jgi:hypothetical protein